MKIFGLSRNSRFTLGRALLAAALLLAASAIHAGPPIKAVHGLWEYTGLTTSKGVEMPIAGIFLIADGRFLQQAVFDGEPFAEQSAMAHTGLYGAGDADVHLIAAQTLSISPAAEEPLADAGVTEHDLQVTRDGENLTLVFGSGTRQDLRRVGAGDNARIYPLATGMFAFSDGYFIIVSGDGESAVTGYGTYERGGDDYTLNIVRWSESAGESATNLKDVTLQAHFDGSVLTFADGREFHVID